MSEGKFQSDIFLIDDAPRNIILGNHKGSLMGSNAFHGSFIAFVLLK